MINYILKLQLQTIKIMLFFCVSVYNLRIFLRMFRVVLVCWYTWIIIVFTILTFKTIALIWV